MKSKILVCLALMGTVAAGACFPASAAERPLPRPDGWYDPWYDDWYDDYIHAGDTWEDPEYYYDYLIEAEETDVFYPPSSAPIYHDGHGNFTTSGGGTISSGDDFITVIPPSGGSTGGSTEGTDGYPVAPPSWQGSGAAGGGSFTDSSVIVQNGVLGTLNIRGRNITVYEGTSDSVLLLGAGHFAGTSAWNGNVALAGHNRGPNAWFSDLINLRPGDPITYMTSAGFRPYTVTGTKIVSVNDLSPLNGSDKNILTLVTCVANRPDVRLIVTAEENG